MFKVLTLMALGSGILASQGMSGPHRDEEAFLIIVSKADSTEAIVGSSIKHEGATASYDVVKAKRGGMVIAGRPVGFVLGTVSMTCGSKSARYTKVRTFSEAGALQSPEPVVEVERSFSSSEGMMKEWSVVCRGESLPDRMVVRARDAAAFVRLANVTTFT